MKDLLDRLDKEQKNEIKKIQIITQRFEPDPGAYKKVIFEKRAPYFDDVGKGIYSFDDSLADLIKRGYERHPRPNEAFSLLCAYLGGKFRLKKIAEDMLFDFGEWLSLAMSYENNLLYCYLDPILESETDRWQYHLKAYTSKIVFNFQLDSLNRDKRILECRWFSVKTINDLNSGLVEFLWSRPFEKLPLKIRNNAYFSLGDLSGGVWPAARGFKDFWYNVHVRDYEYNEMASRGVRLL